MSPRRILLGGFLVAAVCLAGGWAPAVWADEKTADRQETVSREVTGQVSYVTSRFISVETSRSKGGAEEMLIPLTDQTRLLTYRDLSEVQRGDTVKVRYELIYKDGLSGEKLVASTKAVEIALVRNAPRGALTSEGGMAR